jgi:hypothetical protein
LARVLTVLRERAGGARFVAAGMANEAEV